MKKAVFLLMVCILMLTGLHPPVSGETVSSFTTKYEYKQGMYTDVKASEWYARNIQRCYELGLLQGKSNGLFDIKGKLTIAEAVAIAARAHNIYHGGDGNIPNKGKNWYDGAVSYAAANGIIKSSDFKNYTQNATRGQVAYIFSNILPRSEFKALNYIEDGLPDVNYDTPYSQSIFFLYESGVLSGSDKYGTFLGDTYISRAEAASIIIRVVSPADRVTFAPDSYIFLGNIPITDPYTKFRYFTNRDNGPAPGLDYSLVRISSMQNPYDNASSKPEEIVTKSEGIKVILNMVLDQKEAGALEKKPAGAYKNAAWVEYAEEHGLIDAGAITSANESSPITLRETLDCLIPALKEFAPEVDFSSYGKAILGSFLSEYSDTTRYNYVFAYYYDFLEDSAIYEQVNLEEQITKGKMDLILTNVVNGFNVINGKKGQIKTSDLPKNADSYPYILAGIENEVYEMPFSSWDSDPASPRLCYKTAKDMYSRIDQMITEAYTDLVNIDYETISEDSFAGAKRWSLDYSCGWGKELDGSIEKYIDYVKKNKIKITGKVTPILPIVYSDGSNYRVRTKIEYTIVSSDTKVDLLLCDRIAYSGSLKLCYSPTIYEKRSNTIYVDVALDAGLTFNGDESGLIYYLGDYFPLSKQIAGKFAVQTVKL